MNKIPSMATVTTGSAGQGRGGRHGNSEQWWGDAAGHRHCVRPKALFPCSFDGKGGSTSAYISTFFRTPGTASIGPSRDLTHKTMGFSACLQERKADVFSKLISEKDKQKKERKSHHLLVTLLRGRLEDPVEYLYKFSVRVGDLQRPDGITSVIPVWFHFGSKNTAFTGESIFLIKSGDMIL